MNELNFLLERDDDWPPVSHECLPCIKISDSYKIDDAPFFIKGLSVGDIIDVKFNEKSEVIDWKIIDKSKRTTIWILRLSIESTEHILNVLSELRNQKCNTSELSQFGMYTVDVPEDLDIGYIDKCLESFDRSKVAVAFPSFRHQDSK